MRIHALLLSTLMLAITGCDVSKGGSSSSSQDPDPVVVDFAIAYVKRPLPRDEDGELLEDEVFDPAAFKPGAQLIYKDRASVPADEVVLTDSLFVADDSDTDNERPMYDVKDLSVNSDGTKLLFAMRAPEIPNADEEDQPKWNIWEYDLETEIMRRVIVSDITAEEGHDVAPAYLPDGKIVFSSNRQRRSKAILLDENKPQFAALTEDGQSEAFVLHVMDEDGNDIEQITFNQSHDLQPTVLADGRLLFLRWDNYNRNRLSLYTANPDGSNVNPHYGYHSQNTATGGAAGAFIRPRQMPDGRILVALQPRSSTRLGGDMLLVDAANYVDINQAVETSEESTTPGQESLANQVITSDDSASEHGYFTSAYPLFDGTNRLLVSWSPCMTHALGLGVYINNNNELVGGQGQFVNRRGDTIPQDGTPVTVTDDEIGLFPCTKESLALDDVSIGDPLYSLWVYDPTTGTQAPVTLSERDSMTSDVVVFATRNPAPLHIPRRVAGVDAPTEWFDEDVGVVHIRSVYDLDGVDTSPNGIAALRDPGQANAADRPARFLKIIKAVSLPDDDIRDFDNSAFGLAGGQRMKDILGYVPIEPDGSVSFKVPADVAFTFSILDANGKRISPHHQNWLMVREGETRECKGCHAANSTVPHGRNDADIASVNPGAAGDLPFTNTVLFDQFDERHPNPEAGQSMAEYYASVNDPRTPSVNIVYKDDWTDETIRPKDPEFDYSYNNIPSGSVPLIKSSCLSEWDSLCRITINYPDHIQPMWQVTRQTFDDQDPPNLLEDRTCIACHSTANAVGQAQVPASQLDLTDAQSTEEVNYLISFYQLTRGYFRQVIDENGNLVRAQIQDRDENGNLLFVTEIDEEGNEVFVLDEEGNMIPILIDAPEVGRSIIRSGAFASQSSFFSLFEAGGSHEGDLNGAELKLLAEWLDIGGQYYNNPFEAPED